MEDFERFRRHSTRDRHQQPRRKLTADDVQEIHRLYRTENKTQGEIAYMYGISQPHVSFIIKWHAYEEDH